MKQSACLPSIIIYLTRIGPVPKPVLVFNYTTYVIESDKLNEFCTSRVTWMGCLHPTEFCNS
jgi:hypothetical protein